MKLNHVNHPKSVLPRGQGNQKTCKAHKCHRRQVGNAEETHVSHGTPACATPLPWGLEAGSLPDYDERWSIWISTMRKCKSTLDFNHEILGWSVNLVQYRSGTVQVQYRSWMVCSSVILGFSASTGRPAAFKWLTAWRLPFGRPLQPLSGLACHNMQWSGHCRSNSLAWAGWITWDVWIIRIPNTIEYLRHRLSFLSWAWPPEVTSGLSLWRPRTNTSHIGTQHNQHFFCTCWRN